MSSNRRFNFNSVAMADTHAKLYLPVLAIQTLLIVSLPGTASVIFPRSVESVCPATPRMMPRCGSTEWQWSVVRSNHFCVPESKIRFTFERAPVTFHLFDLTSSATKLVSVATCASSDAEVD